MDITDKSWGRNVYELIAAVSAEIAQTGISKARSNQQQGYKFRGIDDVYNALAPILAKHKLIIVPRFLSREVIERQTQKGGVLFNVTVEGEFDFVSAIDGSKHTARTFGEAMDSADKATNKAMSAAYKYAAFQAFCIPTEGDNDADAHTHEVAQPSPTSPNPEVSAPAGRPVTFGVEGRIETPGPIGAYVTNVRVAKKGTSEKGPWTLWVVKFSDGTEGTTFSSTIANSAMDAKQHGVPVLPVINNKSGKNVIEALDRVA